MGLLFAGTASACSSGFFRCPAFSIEAAVCNEMLLTPRCSPYLCEYLYNAVCSCIDVTEYILYQVLSFPKQRPRTLYVCQNRPMRSEFPAECFHAVLWITTGWDGRGRKDALNLRLKQAARGREEHACDEVQPAWRMLQGSAP